MIPVDCDHLFLVLANSQFGLHGLCLFNFYLFLVTVIVIDFFAIKFSRSFSYIFKMQVVCDHYE